MWIGELITEKGVGNGISLLITISITTQLPYILSTIWRGISNVEVESTVLDDGTSVEVANNFSVFGWFELPVNGDQLGWAAIILVATLLTTLFVVYLNEAQRRIKLSYAKRIQGNRVYSDVSTFLPIKLISAGVIPIILAVAFLSLPQMFGAFTQNVDSTFWSNLAQNLTTWFSPPGGEDSPTGWLAGIYPASYFALVVAFTYFYTNIVFSPKDISERLQKQGGFIENVRPGADTQKYLSKIVNRLNFSGAIALAFLAVSPILAALFFNVNTSLVLGGNCYFDFGLCFTRNSETN